MSSRYFSFFALAVTGLLATAAPWSTAATAIDNVVAGNHAAHPVWLRLLHYESPGLRLGQARSAVISPDFFLAPAGAHDPHAELAATVAALMLPPGADPDSHAQCRFPARYLWLKKELDFRGEPQVDCPAYRDFSSRNGVDSVSLVLATGYLENPASFYGHTLLKLNARGQATGLLDESLNYGAIVPDNPNPLAYVIKGIFGGYEGGFTHIRYYFHDHNYGETELRDLWEYELNLTPDEAAFVAAHAWEMVGKRYDYYFFRRNCAYRIGALLEIVEGLEAVPDNYAYTIPQAIVQNLGLSAQRGNPLIRAVRYHPSRQTRLHRGFEELTPVERGVLINNIMDAGSFRSPDFEALPLEGKHAVLDVAMDYYQYRSALEDTTDSALAAPYYQALAMRFQLPTLEESLESRDARTAAGSVSPHLGRKPGLLRLGLYGSGADSGMLLTLRPAYYDALDAGPGHVNNGRLSMAEVAMAVNDEGMQLRYLDAINIESVHPSRTALPGDGGNAWMLRVGVERQHLDCERCLVARLQADRGRAALLGNRVAVAIYAGGALQENRHGEGHGFGRLTLTATMKSGNFGLGGRIEGRRHWEGDLGAEVVTRVTFRYSFSHRQELRLEYEDDGARAFYLTAGFYW